MMKETEEFATRSPLNFRTYSFRESLFAELERLVHEKRRFDGLIIDLMQTEFSLPLDTLVKFHNYARRLLKPHGIMLFIKADAAVTLTKDDPGGGLVLNVYDSPFGLFARYPVLADYVCATVAGIDRRRMRGGGDTLASHILFTSMPVLTGHGQKVKNSFELPAPHNWLIQLIDDYTTIESITRRMETQHNVHPDETLRLLNEMETDGLIYPVFSRIQFLSGCYHNHKPFRLGRYMVAAGILTPAQLEELLERQQEEGFGRSQRTLLGVLAIKAGYLNTRELEILLHDQYLYGGYHRVHEEANSITLHKIENMKDSMIGSLGAIDSPGLLQSIATAKKTGLLTVEHRDNAVSIDFTQGRPTHARLGKLKGAEALLEFLVRWREGIFVFRDRHEHGEFDEDCKLSAPLDKMLLDAAFIKDSVDAMLAKLPSELSTICERVWNFDEKWAEVSAGQLLYFDESQVDESHKARIPSIAARMDGFTTLTEVLDACQDWPSYMVLRAVQLLLDHQLVQTQQASLFKPLLVFQKLAAEIQESLGPEDNRAMLEASLHYVLGDSPAAQRFNIDRAGHVSINISQVKSSSTPVSMVLLELRRWMEAYLAYARRQMDPSVVDGAITRVVQGLG